MEARNSICILLIWVYQRGQVYVFWSQRENIYRKIMKKLITIIKKNLGKSKKRNQASKKSMSRSLIKITFTAMSVTCHLTIIVNTLMAFITKNSRILIINSNFLNKLMKFAWIFTNKLMWIMKKRKSKKIKKKL